jgi:UDP-N-acetyl-D-mannosaminuronate dehydrogenase
MQNLIKENLLTKIGDRSIHMAVLGMGYVGLPLATVFAEAGFRVTGIDPDQEKIKALSEGRSYIKDVPTEQLAGLVASGKLSGTTDFAVLEEVDAVSICVPTHYVKRATLTCHLYSRSQSSWPVSYIPAWSLCSNPLPIRALLARFCSPSLPRYPA